MEKGMTMTEEVTIERTRVHRLYSEKIGQKFLLNISVPPMYNASGTPYPVVYMTDGGPGFLAVSSVIPMMQLAEEIEPFITVGITYDVEHSSDIMTLRTRELTHCAGGMGEPSENMPDWMKKLPPAEPGGAEDFLAFINTQVKTVVQQSYNASADDECYVGYSLGGLFGLYALFNQPDSFSRYVIGSPSIWWGEKDILAHEQRYAETKNDLAASVFMSSGSLEEHPTRADPYSMVTNMLALSQTLEQRRYNNLNLMHQVIEDETHLSGHPVTIIRGLRKVFGRPNRTDT
jgi:predicted alpha/beta superfamily hydrolase